MHTFNSYPDRNLLKKVASKRKLKVAQANAEIAGDLVYRGYESDGQQRSREERTQVVSFGESTFNLFEQTAQLEDSQEPSIPDQDAVTDQSVPQPLVKGILKKSGEKPKWKTSKETILPANPHQQRASKSSIKQTNDPNQPQVGGVGKRSPARQAGSAHRLLAISEEGHPMTIAFNEEINKLVTHSVHGG